MGIFDRIFQKKRKQQTLEQMLDRIFGVFDECLQKSDPAKMFIYYDLGGQDCLIGCVKKESLKILRSRGIKFEPLCK